MAVTLPNKGKNTDMRAFSPLGGGANIKITQNAAPDLYALAKKFPEAVGNALFMLGGHTRKRMRKAVDSGGTTAHKWLELSDMRKYRRMDRLKRGKLPRQSYRGARKKNPATGLWGTSGLIAKAKDQPDPEAIFGRAGRALAFRVPKKQLLVEIGALSSWSARFLGAVQEGRRGSKGAFQFAGRQHVTPAMRRAMWAAGFPLAKETTFIGQEERPLVPDVYREIRPEIEDYLIRRVTEYLHNQGIDWMKS